MEESELVLEQEANLDLRTGLAAESISGPSTNAKSDRGRRIDQVASSDEETPLLGRASSTRRASDDDGEGPTTMTGGRGGTPHP